MNRCFSEGLFSPTNIDPQHIKAYQYEEFRSLLSIETIKQLSEECQQKHINTKGIKKDIKLPKKTFIPIMQSIFSNAKHIYPIYELLFNRFKTIKCQLKNLNKNYNSFFIHNIYEEDEIPIYEVSCALCCFIKCEFQSKLHLLFNLTDIDDDGYISKSEIKKLIYTINSIFSKEESGIDTNSTIIFQSLASIKSKRYYQMLMNTPGNLADEIGNSSSINYDQFYSAIQRLGGYSINIIPCFINFKDYLNTKRTEEEIKIKQKHYKDYAHISNDLISVIKNDNEYDKGGSSNESRAKLLFKSISSNHIRSRPMEFENNKRGSSKKNQLLIQTRQSVNVFNLSTAQRKRSVCLNYNANKENVYVMEYNKINSMQSYPGKITIVEPSKTEVIKSKLPLIKIKNNNTCKQALEHKGSFLTLEKMNKEMNFMSNKKRIEEQSTQHLINVENTIEKASIETRQLLKESYSHQNLIIKKCIRNPKMYLKQLSLYNDND